MSAGQEIGSPIRENRTLLPAPLPPDEARGTLAAAAGVCRVGAKDYSFAPLTEPDMRATHPALWIDISEVQRELERNLRRVKVVPHSFERGHPSGEPCR
jgi:hypothetical protein